MLGGTHPPAVHHVERSHITTRIRYSAGRDPIWAMQRLRLGEPAGAHLELSYVTATSGSFHNSLHRRVQSPLATPTPTRTSWSLMARVKQSLTPVQRQLHPSVPQSTNFSRLLVTAMALASFGPYIAGGMRTEQATVYVLGLLALPFAWSRLQIYRSAAWIYLPWAGYAGVALVGGLLPTAVPLRWPSGSLIAGLDNIVLPLTVVTLVWATVPAVAAPTLLRRVAVIIATAMSVNSVVAMAALHFDLTWILRPFWAALSQGTTTAENAAELGRVGGIFNQPAEAGLMYGIAGVAAIYAWRKRPVTLYLALSLLVLGGLLSVSKIFILGALPVLLWHLWHERPGTKRLTFTASAIAAGLAILQSGLLSSWTGANYLGRLLRPEDDLLAFYSAGRVANNSLSLEIILEVGSTSPLFGLGAAGLQVPYDSGWIEALALAGVVGIICYLLALLGMARVARAQQDPSLRRLTWGLVFISTGASIGLPALTANRIATILWIFIALCALSANRQHPRGRLISIQCPPRHVLPPA